MREDEVNINNTEVEIKKIVKQEGEFVNENGQKIEFTNYKMKVKMGNYMLVWKLEKPFKEIIEEVIREENLLS